jgi:hypothetical protein
MKYALITAPLLGFAVTVLAHASACQIAGGTTYCNAVQMISWSNFGVSGTYDRVIAMDSTDGYCGKESTAYAGGMAPFDGEVSWHFRGPVALKQFGWYTLAGVNAERDESKDKRSCGGEVYQAMNGQLVSWANEYCPGATPTSIAAPIHSTLATQTIAPAPTSIVPGIFAKPAPWISSVSSAPTAPAPSTRPNIGTWVRQGYYGATQGVSDGLVFLNNLGGPGGSGVWDE